MYRRLCRNCYKCARSFLLVLLEQSPKIDRFVRKSHFSTTSVYFNVASKRSSTAFIFDMQIQVKQSYKGKNISSLYRFPFVYSKRPNIGPADYWSLTLHTCTDESLSCLAIHPFPRRKAVCADASDSFHEERRAKDKSTPQSATPIPITPDTGQNGGRFSPRPSRAEAVRSL